MPFIELTTNVKTNAQAEKELYRELGKLISLIPGKTEQWLMIHIEDEAKLCFAGSTDAAAIIKLAVFGREQEEEVYTSLTRELSDCCGKILKISPDRIYTEYEHTLHWGWNSKNFQLRK